MTRLGPVAGWALGAALGLAACGGARVVSVADGGVDGSTADGGADADGSAAEAHHGAAYQITATIDTLTPDPSQGGEWDQFPRTATFTLDWDGTSAVGYVGGGGVFSVTSLAAHDGGFTAPGDVWSVGVPFDTDCRGMALLAFDTANELSVNDDGGLHGSATGHASYQTSAAALSAAIHVTFTGVPDTTAPTFTLPKSPVDPLAPLAFVPSEVLPGADIASLVGAKSGDVVPLAKRLLQTSVDALADVHVAGIALRYDETYRLVTEGLPDFAGNAPVAPVSFTTTAAPPLVPEDGFESVTGTMFGGAGVLNGGPLPPLAGQTSLLLNTGYGGGFGFLPYDLGPSLVVRLTVAPGDTVVRFDSELIAPDPIDAASFVGELRVAAVAGPVGVQHGVDGTGFTKVTLPQLGDVYVSPVKTIELPLPAGAQGEITFEIVGTTDLCEQPPPPTVLVVDNLRVE